VNKAPDQRPVSPSQRRPGSSRLDQALVSRGLCTSREQAQRLILAGRVHLNQQVANKPGKPTRPNDQLVVVAPERYVSRGGRKLEHALQYFHLDVQGCVAVDLGASTGGFTDCLLQHGAARVFAVDVGRGQLAWRLRNDPRVVVMERCNARRLTRSSFPPPFHHADLVVIDCSFISLRLLLPSAIELLDAPGRIVALIKPQFEAGRSEADRGRGVIRDPAVRARVLLDLEQFASGLRGCHWQAATESPLLGPAGNIEFLACLEKAP